MPYSDDSHQLLRIHQAVATLNQALQNLLDDAPKQAELAEIIANAHFSSAQDESIAHWFAGFITVRRNLSSLVDIIINTTGGPNKISLSHSYPYFVLGYSALCSVYRMDRHLITKVANHTVIQRKLNQAFPSHQIERKQFNAIYKSLVDPLNALRIHRAHRTLLKQYDAIQSAVADTPIAITFAGLRKQERYLNLSRSNFLLNWLRSRRLVWRRRGASAKQKSVFTVLEYGGRIASELNLPRPKRVTPKIRGEIAALLKPGDILVTRHRRALTNLFLPGFWPHAALYVGYDTDRTRMGIEITSENAAHWCEMNCTLEALKDGVHFRPLSDTLSVDAFVVLRPNITTEQIATALQRASTHRGKGYNFDFDFFRSDHLVCTEVVYRAFDGLAGREMPLQERMGRKTLSAEDLLDLALDTDWAEPVAIFGVADSQHQVVTGPDVHKILHASYRSEKAYETVN